MPSSVCLSRDWVKAVSTIVAAVTMVNANASGADGSDRPKGFNSAFGLSSATWSSVPGDLRGSGGSSVTGQIQGTTRHWSFQLSMPFYLGGSSQTREPARLGRLVLGVDYRFQPTARLRLQPYARELIDTNGARAIPALGNATELGLGLGYRLSRNWDLFCRSGIRAEQVGDRKDLPVWMAVATFHFTPRDAFQFAILNSSARFERLQDTRFASITWQRAIADRWTLRVFAMKGLTTSSPGYLIGMGGTLRLE